MQDYMVPCNPFFALSVFSLTGFGWMDFPASCHSSLSPLSSVLLELSNPCALEEEVGTYSPEVSTSGKRGLQRVIDKHHIPTFTFLSFPFRLGFRLLGLPHPARLHFTHSSRSIKEEILNKTTAL